MVVHPTGEPRGTHNYGKQNHLQPRTIPPGSFRNRFYQTPRKTSAKLCGCLRICRDCFREKQKHGRYWHHRWKTPSNNLFPTLERYYQKIWMHKHLRPKWCICGVPLARMRDTFLKERYHYPKYRVQICPWERWLYEYDSSANIGVKWQSSKNFSTGNADCL